MIPIQWSCSPYKGSHDNQGVLSLADVDLITSPTACTAILPSQLYASIFRDYPKARPSLNILSLHFGDEGVIWVHARQQMEGGKEKSKSNNESRCIKIDSRACISAPNHNNRSSRPQIKECEIGHLQEGRPAKNITLAPTSQDSHTFYNEGDFMRMFCGMIVVEGAVIADSFLVLRVDDGEGKEDGDEMVKTNAMIKNKSKKQNSKNKSKNGKENKTKQSTKITKHTPKIVTSTTKINIVNTKQVARNATSDNKCTTLSSYPKLFNKLATRKLQCIIETYCNASSRPPLADAIIHKTCLVWGSSGGGKSEFVWSILDSIAADGGADCLNIISLDCSNRRIKYTNKESKEYINLYDPSATNLQALKRVFKLAKTFDNAPICIFVDKIDALSSDEIAFLASFCDASDEGDFFGFLVCAGEVESGGDGFFIPFDCRIHLTLPGIEERTSFFAECINHINSNNNYHNDNYTNNVPQIVELMAKESAGLSLRGLQRVYDELVKDCIPIPMAITDQKEYIQKVFNKHHNHRNSNENSNHTKYTWDSLGGIQKTRQILEGHLGPFNNANNENVSHRMKILGISKVKGILLHGPPGCSKTSIARIIAQVSKMPMFTLDCAHLFSKWVGEGERLLRETFEKGRQCSPSIIFIDEIDILVGRRGSGVGVVDRVQEGLLSTLLNEMDGIEAVASGDVLVIGATNRIDAIDDALLRPGRFDLKLLIDYPNQEERIEILKCHLRPCPHTLLDSEIAEICAGLGDHDPNGGVSGADLKGLVQEAALLAIRQGEEILMAKHFWNVINGT